MADPKLELGKHAERRELTDAPFENILNFRDVGRTINEFLGQKYAVHSNKTIAVQGRG
jgi:hypothetical protein